MKIGGNDSEIHINVLHLSLSMINLLSLFNYQYHYQCTVLNFHSFFTIKDINTYAMFMLYRKNCIKTKSRSVKYSYLLSSNFLLMNKWDINQFE